MGSISKNNTQSTLNTPDNISGDVNIPNVFLTYHGVESNSAIVAIDNTNRAISVKVKPSSDRSINDVKVDNISVVDDRIADIILQPKIDLAVLIEKNRAIAAESGLSDRLEAEILRALGVESGIRDDLVAEVLRAKGRENEIAGNLTSEINRAKVKEGELDTAISEEATRAKGAESVLESGLAAEIKRSTDEDIVIRGLVAAEESRAKTAEGTLTANLSNEITRATNKETELAGKISDEETARKAADKVLESGINDEMIRAISEEARIEGKIDAEVTRALNKENELESGLIAEILARINKDSDLQTNIDKCVKLSGNETISGTKTFEQPIYAKINTTQINSNDNIDVFASAVNFNNATKLVGLSTPSFNSEAVNKKYVDDQDKLTLDLAGTRTMTGDLDLNVHDINRVNCITTAELYLGYFAADDEVICVASDLDFNGMHKIVNVSTPVNNSDAATKEYVDLQIQTETAVFRGNFATKTALDAYAGEKTNNDYAVVEKDETHTDECWRYKYNGAEQKWLAEYKINDTPFTEAQKKAINSTITKEKVDKYDSLNIENGTGTGSLIQKGDTITFTVDNPNASNNGETVNAESNGIKSSAVFNGGSRAVGSRSFAASAKTQAIGDRTAAFGNQAVAEGANSFVCGNQTTTKGTASFATGKLTLAKGDNSFASGEETKAYGVNSHAEGLNNKTSGIASHAEGKSTEAGGVASHAEGQGNIASGDQSHAEGLNNKTSGIASHAEGGANEATGNYTHVSGLGNTANYSNQFVCGHHNLNKANTLFEVGNGEPTSPGEVSKCKNAFEVYEDGHVVVGKAIGSETDLTVATKGYVDSNFITKTSDGKLKIGSTTLDETQLKKLIVLLDTLEAE